MRVLDAHFEKSAPELAEAPLPDCPEICFVGRSNVGKSSALNRLVGRRQLARVSKAPGRTRLLNFFLIDVADRSGPRRRTATLRFCDLPGYGFARVSKGEKSEWARMIGDYLQDREKLAAVVLLIDAEIGPQPKDHEMVELLVATRRTVMVVATKADRIGRPRWGAALDKIASELGVPRSAVFPFSSTRDIGHHELWDALCAAAGIFDKQSDRLLEPAPMMGKGES